MCIYYVATYYVAKSVAIFLSLASIDGSRKTVQAYMLAWAYAYTISTETLCTAMAHILLG